MFFVGFIDIYLSVTADSLPLLLVQDANSTNIEKCC